MENDVQLLHLSHPITNAQPIGLIDVADDPLAGATVKVDILDYGSLLTKTTADFVGHTAIVVLQLIVFLAKVMLVCSFQILIRWSLPRFRYDQVLSFAWKFMLPLAIANLTVTAIAVWALTP